MMTEQLLRILSGVFVGIYIARHLGPENFGILSYALAISAFVISISRLGMDAILIREIVNAPDNYKKLIGTAFWLMQIAAAACCIVLIVFIWQTNEQNDIKVFTIIISLSSFFTAFSVVDYHFQSQVRAKISSICKSLSLLVISLLKIYLIFIDADLFSFVLVSLLEYVILAVFLMVAMGKSYNLEFLKEFNRELATQMLKSAWPMVLTAVAMLVYMRIDQIMIRKMLGLEEVGIYSAAVKIYEAWIVLPYVITISLLPAIINLKKNNTDTYHVRMTQIFRLVIWMSIAAALITTLISEPLMVASFGPEYSESAGTLQIVMWTAVFTAMGSASARYFSAEHMEKKIALRTGLAATLNVLLNLILIPAYGINGAAAATLFCTFFANYLMDWFDPDLKTLLKIKHSAIFGNPFK